MSERPSTPQPSSTFRRAVTAGLAGVVVSLGGCLPTAWYLNQPAPAAAIWVATILAVPALLLGRTGRVGPSSEDDRTPHGGDPTGRAGRRGAHLKALATAWAVAAVGSALATAALVLAFLGRLSAYCRSHGGC